MPNRLPTLVINTPAPNAVVGTASFYVTGVVTAPGMPEPVGIDSVTVQVDAQPPVEAVLKHIPNLKLVEVTFIAAVQITGGQDPHIVKVTVASDAGVPVTRSVSVNVGPRLAAPSLLIDLATVGNVDPNSPPVQNMLQNLSRKVASLPLVGQLQSVNKIVVGPNILALTDPRPLLRVGLWVLDADFPASELIPPSADFPLRRFTADAAQASFGLAPLLVAPPPSVVPPASAPMFGFGLSVPTATLQSVLDANFSDIADQAASNHFTVQSATVATDNAGSVITTLSGSLPLGIGMTATLTEKLGIEQRPGTEQFMPAVISSSHSVSVGSAVDWVIGALFPAVGLILAGAYGLASYGVGQASGQASGIIGDLLGSLPARLPFRNSSLPAALQSSFSFPMAVLNFESFTTDGSGIVGSGTVSLGARDQDMVSVHLGGPTYFPNYSEGIESFYKIALSHFEPDNDQMTWKVIGTKNSDTVNTDAFWQRGGFAAGFPLPLKPSPGKYHFTLNVSATETCATDVSKTLTGSASLVVTANVVKGSEPAVREAGLGRGEETATA